MKDAPRWIGGVEPPDALLSASDAEVLKIECREQPEKTSGDDSRVSERRRDQRGDSKAARACTAQRGDFVDRDGRVLLFIFQRVGLQTHGRLAFSVDAGEWLHYAQPIWNDAALSLLLTASGENAELVELFRTGKRSTARTDFEQHSEHLFANGRKSAPDFGRA
jgi:glucosamine--fructose-6-phosphate aminotransferase (isomerizing)